MVNLAAGLDARPWRLPLPPSLHWVDVDLPGILNYKTETLKGETPKCRYEAVTADLTDAGVRRALFARLGAEATRALIIAEGLLIYLQPEQVGSARHRAPRSSRSFREWLIDLASPQLLKRMSKTWGKQVHEGGAPFLFAPAEDTAFFLPFGWREEEYRSLWEEALRLDRTMKGAKLWTFLGRFYPRKVRESFRRFSGLVLLERT